MGYSYDKFLRPLTSSDRNIQIQEDNGVVKWTVEPFSVINAMVSNNVLKVNVLNRVILVPFSSHNEAKLALEKIQLQIDGIKTKAPNELVDLEIKNYVNNYINDTLIQDMITNIFSESNPTFVEEFLTDIFENYGDILTDLLNQYYVDNSINTDLIETLLTNLYNNNPTYLEELVSNIFENETFVEEFLTNLFENNTDILTELINNILNNTEDTSTIPLYFVRCATLFNIPNITYNNGIDGIGSTIISITYSLIPEIDSINLENDELVLIKNQTAQLQNGIYIVTSKGGTSSNFILTRTDYYDESFEIFPSQVNVTEGVKNINKYFLQKTESPIIGTSSIIYSEGRNPDLINSPVIFSANIVNEPLLGSPTYSSTTILTGNPGYNATYNASVNGTFSSYNGLAPSNGMRIVINGELDENYNGFYTIVDKGSATTKYKLTRIFYQNWQLYPKLFYIYRTGTTEYKKLYISKYNITNATVGSSPIKFETASVESTTADNGLSIIGSDVVLGGTLSQNTTINGAEYDFILGGVEYILMTSSVFDVEADLVSIDSGNGPVQIMGDDIAMSGNNVDVMGTFSINGTTVAPNLSPLVGQALIYDGSKFAPSDLPLPQTLSINVDQLSISDGNTVTIPTSTPSYVTYAELQTLIENNEVEIKDYILTTDKNGSIRTYPYLIKGTSTNTISELIEVNELVPTDKYTVSYSRITSYVRFENPGFINGGFTLGDTLSNIFGVTATIGHILYYNNVVYTLLYNKSGNFTTSQVITNQNGASNTCTQYQIQNGDMFIGQIVEDWNSSVAYKGEVLSDDGNGTAVLKTILGNINSNGVTGLANNGGGSPYYCILSKTVITELKSYVKYYDFYNDIILNNLDRSALNGLLSLYDYKFPNLKIKLNGLSRLNDTRDIYLSLVDNKVSNDAEVVNLSRAIGGINNGGYFRVDNNGISIGEFEVRLGDINIGFVSYDSNLETPDVIADNIVTAINASGIVTAFSIDNYVVLRGLPGVFYDYVNGVISMSKVSGNTFLYTNGGFLRGGGKYIHKCVYDFNTDKVLNEIDSAGNSYDPDTTFLNDFPCDTKNVVFNNTILNGASTNWNQFGGYMTNNFIGGNYDFALLGELHGNRFLCFYGANFINITPGVFVRYCNLFNTNTFSIPVLAAYLEFSDKGDITTY